jgi:hypothetical protein
MAVTAVGAITGNEDLLKAGKIMGYVGLGSAVGGGLLGGASTFFEGGASSFMSGVKGAFTGAGEQISKSWKEGVGSWFSSDAGAATKAVGPAGVEDLTAKNTGIVVDTPDTTIVPNTSKYTGVGDFRAPANTLPAGQNPAGLSQTITPGDMSQFAPKTAPSPTTGLLNATQAANVGPVAPTVAPEMKSFDFGSVVNQPPPEAPGLLAGVPDWAKYAAMTSGAQGLTGLASGYFQGLSAEEQLEFQKMVNAQREAQVQLQNRNNAYAPVVTFR